VLVAVVFFVPRVVKARFGLLDDGVTISVARAILGHPAVALHAYAGAGRFLPCYWIYNAWPAPRKLSRNEVESVA